MSISYTSFLLELQDRLTSSISSERMTAVFYIEFNDMSYLRELIQCLDEKQLINNIQTKIDTILQKKVFVPLIIRNISLLLHAQSLPLKMQKYLLSISCILSLNLSV